MKYLLYSIIFSIAFSCDVSESSSKADHVRQENFDAYWFSSKAEITSYELEQARYGEIRKGTASLIFVSEPFDSYKSVKADNAMGKNVEHVLKLNHQRNFNTGIYPYNIMTSSFTPIENPRAGSCLKINHSTQEWCGQVYSQLVKKGNQYDLQSFSYFEQEGDQRFSVKESLLEDEILSLIRINPDILVNGEYKLVPALHFTSLMHKEVKNYNAILTNSKVDENRSKITVKYKNLNREVSIIYSSEFPFEIEEWEESYQALNGKEMKTKARVLNRTRVDYWNKNSNEDYQLYKDLFNLEND